MPEHLRAFIVLAVLAALVFAMARRPALDLMDGQDFVRRRNLWFGLTILAFLSHSFWLYVIIGGSVLLFVGQREHNRVALFFFLLFLIPSAPAQIPGFGLINYVFALDHVRLLTLVIFLPGFVTLIQRSDTEPFGRTWPDRLLTLYLVLTGILRFRDPEGTLTNTMRDWFDLFVDVFLPYYVISRSLRDMTSFRDSLVSFVLAVMILAIAAVFEILRHWNLYGGLLRAMGLYWGYGYLGRSGMLRATATVGQPIVLGYVMAVAIGFYLFLKDEVRSRLNRRLGGSLLAAGIIAPLSRGPWVGLFVSFLAYIWTGRQAGQRLAFLAAIGIFSLPVLAVLPIPGGQKAIELLPFVGSVESENIDYRDRLLDNSIIVIKRNLLFGSVDFLDTPELESMIQGQGIVDLVNTYIQVALHTGIVGLGLFIGFFAIVLLNIRRSMRALQDKNDEMYRLGRALFATLVGILVTIFTVSSIIVIPVVYWSVAGLGVAYTYMVKKRIAEESAVVAPEGIAGQRAPVGIINRVALSAEDTKRHL